SGPCGPAPGRSESGQAGAWPHGTTVSRCLNVRDLTVAGASAPRPRLPDAPHDLQQVLTAVERIVVITGPGRDRPADRLVPVEGRFQHALAARQARQRQAQLVD